MDKHLEKSIQMLRNELLFANKMYASLKEQMDSVARHKENLVQKIKNLEETATEEFINEFKQKHSEDNIVLFRCGNFYECYGKDAVVVSTTLGITLHMDKPNTGLKSCFAAFSYSSLDTYLPRLIRAGKRVAIADEIKVY